MIRDTTDYTKAKGMFGVFRTDCYRIPFEQKKKFFIKAFENYGDALKFAQDYSPDTAIHIVV